MFICSVKGSIFQSNSTASQTSYQNKLMGMLMTFYCHKIDPKVFFAKTVALLFSIAKFLGNGRLIRIFYLHFVAVQRYSFKIRVRRHVASHKTDAMEHPA